jgi:hypothetical protein
MELSLELKGQICLGNMRTSFIEVGSLRVRTELTNLEAKTHAKNENFLK